MTQQQLNIKHHNFLKIWVNLCIYTLKNLPQAKQSPQISSPSLPESSSSKCEHPVSEQWLGFFLQIFPSLCNIFQNSTWALLRNWVSKLNAEIRFFLCHVEKLKWCEIPSRDHILPGWQLSSHPLCQLNAVTIPLHACCKTEMELGCSSSRVGSSAPVMWGN